VEIAADGDAARQLAELITNITARRFVSAHALAEHGFGKPFAVITATLPVETFDDKGRKDQTQSKEVVLQVGAQTADKGRFARLVGADPTVFVIGREYEEAIRSPFVARDLLQIDDTNLIQLTLVQSGREVVFMKDDNGWSTADSREIDLVHFKRILADLSAMKTVRTHSFSSANASFDKTTIVIKAVPSNNSEKATVMTVGPRSEDAQENGYLARSNDLAVTFVIPARIIEELFAFTDM
jgi:hypothetical protein